MQKPKITSGHQIINAELLPTVNEAMPPLVQRVLPCSNCTQVLLVC